MMSEAATTESVKASPSRDRDASLLARTAAGDHRAFETIHAAYWRPTYRLAYGVLLDKAEARDAVQEAFLQLYRIAPAWESGATIGTWLYRVTLNHCLGLKKRLERALFTSRPRHRRTSPEVQLANKQAVDVVQTALHSMPARQRALACLFLDGELTPAQIAPMMALSPNATRVALHRALTHIREALALAGHEATPTDDEYAILADTTERS